MFTKSFIVFGLLALFACQGTSATEYTSLEKNAIGDLIDQINKVISGLNDLVSGVLGDALSTLGNLVSTIAEIKTKFLQDGLNVITQGVGSVLEFVANKTAQAAELGIDITKCILGTNQTLDKLVQGLTTNLTECIANTVTIVLNTVNAEIKNINNIVKTILAAPVKLTKCLISLRPLTCLRSLLSDLISMTTSLPAEIKKVVDNALALVSDLPKVLLGCVKDITTSVASETGKLISEIGTCVDDLISQSTTTTGVPTTTTGVPSTTSVSTEATVAPAQRASLGELIQQVEEIIGSLTGLVGGVLGQAVDVLKNLISTINQIKEKYLDDGIAVITEGVGSVLDYIQKVTEKGLELGVDLSSCIVGRKDQLNELTTGLTINLTDCVTTTVIKVLQMVNDDLKSVNSIIGQATSAPVKLSKCLISLRPITCVTNLLSDLTQLLASIPSEVEEIIENATGLVKDLPIQLGTCIGNIAEQTAAQTNKIISDIGTCVDDVISGSS